ncbi:MAG: protease inhibitor I9 family protein, partial [Pseudomonadota bacterium]
METKKSWKRFWVGGWLLILFLFLCVIFLSASPLFAQKQGLSKFSGKDIIPGRYIVVLRDHVQDPAFAAGTMARSHRFSVDHVYSRALKGFSAKFSNAALRVLERNPDVASIEPDRRVYAVAQTIPTGV